MRRYLILLLLRVLHAEAFSFNNPKRVSPESATALVNGETASKPTVSRKRVPAVSATVNGDTASRSTDSVAGFEADVTKVIQELRPEITDPTLPRYFTTKRLSFTNYWNLDDWARHNSRWRFVRYIRGFPTSRLTRRLVPQMTGLVLWTLFTLSLHTRSVFFGNMEVPLAGLSIVSTFIAALLTLRTNQALNRLTLGRDAMGRMVLFTRDSAMLFSTYIYPKDKELGLKAARLLSLFGWTLKSHIRDTQKYDVIHQMLPFDAEYEYVTRQRKPPVAILALLRQIMYEMSQRQPEMIGTTEHRLIEQSISALNDVVMACEKLRATPIPPIYSAHATRLMMFYLAGLPWAMFGLGLGNNACMFFTIAVGFAMLGLDEISHIFEMPFRFMPLHQLAKVSMLDVADAFTCRPPIMSSSSSTESDKDLVGESDNKKQPTYWKGCRGSIPYYKPVR